VAILASVIGHLRLVHWPFCTNRALSADLFTTSGPPCICNTQKMAGAETRLDLPDSAS